MRLKDALGYAGALLLLGALAVRLSFAGSAPAALGLAVAGLVLLLAYFFRSGGDVQRFLELRSTRQGSGVAGTTLFLLGAVILVNVLGSRFRVFEDVTSDGLFTLAPETRSAIDQAPVMPEVWVFYPDGSEPQSRMRGLLDGVRLEFPGFRYFVVDPDRDPAAAFRFSLNEYASVVTVGEEEITFTGVDEEALVAAIRRASNPERLTVGFLNGHGEAFPGDGGPDGLRLAAELLHRRGFRIRGVNLLQEDGHLADSVDVLVIAAPVVTPASQEADSLLAFLAKGGRFLVLLDPENPVTLEPLLGAMGVRFVPRFIQDPTQRDPQVILPTDLSGHVVVRDLRNKQVSTVLAGVGEIERGTVEGVRTAGLMWSSSRSLRVGDDDLPRRRILVAAAERVSGPELPPGRMLVVGDRDFAANRLLPTLGNGDLFLSGVSWLTEREAVVSIRPRPRTSRPVVLSKQQGRALMVLMIGILPAGVLGVGFVVWWRRR